MTRPCDCDPYGPEYHCNGCGVRHPEHAPGCKWVDQENEQLDQAVDVVARHVIARLVDAADGAAEEWENYPEIGEYDWERVVDRVAWLIGEMRPDDQAYQDAYTLLERRAEGVEA